MSFRIVRGESFEPYGQLFTDLDSYIKENYVEGRPEEECGTGPAPSIPLPSSARPTSTSQAEMTQAATMPGAAYAVTQQMAAPLTSRQPQLPQAAMPQPPRQPEKAAARKASRFLPPRSASPLMSERSLDDVVAELGETFQQRLLRLIDERGLKDVEVYKKAKLDRKLFSKIRCNSNYRPKKATAVALALALGLNLDETKDLLSRAELALSPSSKFDLIIQYFIDREIYDIYVINLALFRHDQPLLGE